MNEVYTITLIIRTVLLLPLLANQNQQGGYVRCWSWPGPVVGAAPLYALTDTRQYSPPRLDKPLHQLTCAVTMEMIRCTHCNTAQLCTHVLCTLLTYTNNIINKTGASLQWT